MGITNKSHYDSYTLAYKINAVKLSKRKHVKAIDVAEALGIHPVMLYRWRQEFKEGRLSENKYMVVKSPPKPSKEDQQALQSAKTRIKELEKRLAAKEEEVNILKKAKRFFLDQRKKDTRS
ncbi:hypothetical protein R50072_37030 [Simiduia litorea]|uniref:transposase n=1 Tax=Simiduia litorea TaxID=1435348 RepID=UPI0036F22D35